VEIVSGLWDGPNRALEIRVLAPAGVPGGQVVLVGLGGDTGKASHASTADTGLQGIDVYTRDIVATYHQLETAGYQWVAPPKSYEIAVDGIHVNVTEGICLAPDGVQVVFVQAANPRGTYTWEVDPNRSYTELTSVVCNVDDVEAKTRFWGPQGIGLSLQYDVHFSAPGFDEMTALPIGAEVRLAFLASLHTARIEIIDICTTAPQLDRRAAQHPSCALGHTGWVAQTTDLDQVLKKGAAMGGRPTRLCLEVDSPLFGRARVASLTTPNGLSMTFFEVF